MAALPALRPVAIVAAINSAVQGLVGGVLSVLGLCVCFCALGSALDASDDLAQYFTQYLQGEECGNNKVLQLYPTTITSGAALRLWVALSLFFNAAMLVSSLTLIIAVYRQWSDEKLQITLVSWLFINMFTAVDDLILGYVFTNDYKATLDSTGRQNSLGPLAVGLVAFLAVRGVYIWVLNLAFIVYLFTGARALHKYLNEKMSAQVHEPIDSWLRVDDFGQNKGPVDRAPPAVNTGLAAHRMESQQPVTYPEYTAMARWPRLNGQAQSLEGRPQGRGLDNPGYEPETPRYYLRLDSEPGSTRDHEQGPPSKGARGVDIPPVDYLDDLQPRSHRPLSLQEAILDRTVRLKKVPEELKRGFQK